MDIVYWQVCNEATIFGPDVFITRANHKRFNIQLNWICYQSLNWGDWYAHVPTAANDNYDTSKQVFYAR